MTYEEEAVRRNLRDAGCPPELISRFMASLEAGAIRDCSRLLDSHRRALLDDIHAEEEKLMCLDYLRYHLKNGKNR